MGSRKLTFSLSGGRKKGFKRKDKEDMETILGNQTVSREDLSMQVGLIQSKGLKKNPGGA